MAKTQKQRKQEKLETLISRRDGISSRLKDLDTEIKALKQELAEIEKKELADLVIGHGLSIDDLKNMLAGDGDGKADNATTPASNFNPPSQ